MKKEVFKALGINIHVEIYDEDARETIWPMIDDGEDPGTWLTVERAESMTDDEIGRWYLNRYLLDYGNSFIFTVTRGRIEERNFSRRIKE